MIPGDRQQPVRERVQAWKRHVGRADHQRDDEVREAREGRDHEQEDHQRGVDRDEAVVLLRIEVLRARLRQLGAEDHRHQAPGEEEEDRRHEVLDSDHLVVGVDAEVVVPAAGAVAGVVLRRGGVAEAVLDPVVEGADAGQEADRSGDQRRNRDDDQPVEDGLPAGECPDADDDPEPDAEEEGRHPRRAQPPGREEAVEARRRRRRRRVAGVLGELGHEAVRLSRGPFAPLLL